MNVLDSNPTKGSTDKRLKVVKKIQRIDGKMNASAMFELGIPMPTVDQASSNFEPVERDLIFLHRAYCAGSLPALYEALLVCEREKHSAQPWMIRAMQRVLEALARGKLAYGPGPTGNPIVRQQSYWKHFARYDVVLEVRENQGKYRETARWLSEESGLAPEAQKERLRNYHDPGRTWEDAYITAAELLRSTPAFGSKATIKGSYIKIKKLLDDPDKCANLKVFSSRTMRLFALDFGS